MIHVKLDALCAEMQRHGVLLVDLDALKLYVHRMLEATEKRLAADHPDRAAGAITRPDAPASITQRLRALADVDPDDEGPRTIWDPVRKGYFAEGTVLAWTNCRGLALTGCHGYLQRLAGETIYRCNVCGRTEGP